MCLFLNDILTSELVYANITIVMEEKSGNDTKQKIMQCARTVFLEKGYKGANLRSICNAAGVTTGAFYFSFENKEALFRAIVGPVLEEAEKKMPIFLAKEMQDSSTAIENDRKIMEFECLHREEILIAMEKSEGSCYEYVKQKVYDMMMYAFQEYFKGILGKEVNHDLLSILVNMRIQSNLEILKGNYNMEYSLYLADAIGIHADGGTYKLIENIKNDAHH